MGMGYTGGFAITIERDKVNELTDGKLEKMVAYAESVRGDHAMEEFAEVKGVDEDLREDPDFQDVQMYAAEMEKRWEEVQQTFRSRTGLTLDVGHHDSEERGSRYDDLDGVYFALSFNEVYNLTKGAEVLKDHFEIKHFVSYG